MPVRCRVVCTVKIIGDFIVDFYIHSAHLVIELDGSQHTAPEHESEDLKRDSVLASMGITFLRYTNEEIELLLSETIKY